MLRRLPLLCMLLFSMLLLQACLPSSMVNLDYTRAQSSFIPAPNAANVSVVLFEDSRASQNIGQKKDGTFYSPTSSVPEWVSRAVADELSLTGPQVSYASNMSQATSASPKYIVTGEVQDVWIKEENIAKYSTSVRIAFKVIRGGVVIFNETLNSSQESTSLPTASAVEELLSATLKDVASIAASKISEITK